jgi:hypothetical protein
VLLLKHPERFAAVLGAESFQDIAAGTLGDGLVVEVRWDKRGAF